MQLGESTAAMLDGAVYAMHGAKQLSKWHLVDKVSMAAGQLFCLSERHLCLLTDTRPCRSYAEEKQLSLSRSNSAQYQGLTFINKASQY